MIYFEIDGIEYTANINTEPPANHADAVKFTTDDGLELWLHRPVKA